MRWTSGTANPQRRAVPVLQSLLEAATWVITGEEVDLGDLATQTRIEQSKETDTCMEKGSSSAAQNPLNQTPPPPKTNKHLDGEHVLHRHGEGLVQRTHRVGDVAIHLVHQLQDGLPAGVERAKGEEKEAQYGVRGRREGGNRSVQGGAASKEKHTRIDRAPSSAHERGAGSRHVQRVQSEQQFVQSGRATGAAVTGRREGWSDTH